MVRAILFDLDGTLIDSQSDIVWSVQAVQKQFGQTPRSLAEITGFIGDGIGSLMRRTLGFPKSMTPDQEQMTRDAVTLLIDIYRDHCLDQTRLYPGAQALLDFLKPNYAMSLVTNKPIRITHRVLEGLNLAHYFSHVVGGDSLPRKKPYPDQIQFVLDRIDIPAEQVLMVGDSAQDVQAGKAAGVITCGIRSNIGDTQQLDASKPEFMLNRIADLAGILEEITSSETCITKSSKPSA